MLPHPHLIPTPLSQCRTQNCEANHSMLVNLLPNCTLRVQGKRHNAEVNVQVSVNVKQSLSFPSAMVGVSGAQMGQLGPLPPKFSQLLIELQVRKLWLPLSLLVSPFLPFSQMLLCYIWIKCKSPLITHSGLKQTTCCHMFDYCIPGEFLFVRQPVTVNAHYSQSSSC